jgi:hypothetical protein
MHRLDFQARGADFDDAEVGRLSVEQILSARKSTNETWLGILGIEGLLPEIAFKQYVRSMVIAGVSLRRLELEASRRRFAGLWPHQICAGYNAMHKGVTRMATKKVVAYRKPPCPDAAPIFDLILRQLGRGMLPPGLNLGIADISPSMYTVPLGGEHSSVSAGDASTLFAAMMSNDLGYAATFSSNIQILTRHDYELDLAFASRLRAEGTGWGSTQVAGSVVSLIRILLANPAMARPRTLFFFSDMQFHPPDQHLYVPTSDVGAADAAITNTLACTQLTAWKSRPVPRKPRPSDINQKLQSFFAPQTPPLLSAIRAYRSLLGPVDVVLWTLASYDNAPVPSTMENVLMLSGFDVNTFATIAAWQADKSTQEPGLQSLITAAQSSTSTSTALPTVAQRQHAEIQRIRGF